MKFIENIFKELTKIPDNELIIDNEYINNLIINSKNLINKLLLNNNLNNSYIQIKIRLNYYYDKPFYMISINDEQKPDIKMTKQFNFKNSKKHEIKNSMSINSILDKLPSNKSKIKTRNKINEINDKYINKRKDNIISNNLEEENRIKKELIMKKIEKYMNEINKEKFIFRIKLFLLLTILCIFIFYILIIYFHEKSIDITEKILLAFYYNAHTKTIYFYILSKISGLFYDITGIFPFSLSSSYDAFILNKRNIIRIKLK